MTKVEALVSHSAKLKSSLQKSHFLERAIKELHGIPGKKERRSELLDQLNKTQAGTLDEMKTFSQTIDLSEIVERVKKFFGDRSLLDMLFSFACLDESPDPEQLAADATRIIQSTPFSSTIARSHLDRDGKVVARTPGAHSGEVAQDGPLSHRIREIEQRRRQLAVAGKIEIARREIVFRHYISDDVFLPILYNSPFVRPDQVETFARGLTRFFQGDFVSAAYVLTPLLESSLRYLLKAAGHDVTKFDDATQTQQDHTISLLFERMRSQIEGILTPAVAGDVERVFLQKPGPQVRHSVAHGLFNDEEPFGGDAIYACWLIFRLCLLPVVEYYENLLPIYEGL